MLLLLLKLYAVQDLFVKLKPEKNSGLNGIHGFESRSGLNFFQASISQLLKLCV